MVHPLADAFDSSADAYDRGRPGYPDDAIREMARYCALSYTSTILDVGAGTGKLTSQLSALHPRVVAVEPMPGMRRILAGQLPTVDVLDGVAERIPMPDHSVDLVTAAQAFHWFRPYQATAEFHRVLRTGGAVALLWNRRDMEQPLQRAIHAIVTAYRGNVPGDGSDDWKAAFRELFTPLEETSFANLQMVDRDSLVARVMSFSYIAALAPSEHDSIARRLRAEAASLPEVFPLSYTTSLFMCRTR